MVEIVFDLFILITTLFYYIVFIQWFIANHSHPGININKEHYKVWDETVHDEIEKDKANYPKWRLWFFPLTTRVYGGYYHFNEWEKRKYG